MSETPLFSINTLLIDELIATLHANRQELEKVRALFKGTAPLTLKMAAAYLHISRQTLSGYIKNGEIIPSAYGNRVWVIQSELDKFIARHRRKTK